MSERIAIIGGGGWGLTIGKLLCENGNEVLIWEHNPQYLSQLVSTRSNPRLLPDVILPDSILFTGSYDVLIDHDPQLIILATPTQYLRSTLSSLIDHIDSHRPSYWNSCSLEAIVNLAKGIEEVSLLRISEVIKVLAPPMMHDKIFCLSGPSHAEEVANKIPTAVVIAGVCEDKIESLQQLFSSSYFRVYRSCDLVGVEIGGAVKNIIAIASGILDGLGFGDNTTGALLTRGIVEIQRLGVALGAKSETFLGLSGIGDLITTATSKHSRNRFVGHELGNGKKLPEIVSGMSMIAEGVASTRSVYNLASRHNVEMPICQEMYRILYEDKNPLLAISELMSRDLKPESLS